MRDKKLNSAREILNRVKRVFKCKATYKFSSKNQGKDGLLMRQATSEL